MTEQEVDAAVAEDEEDEELDAISEILKRLRPLSPAGKRRVITFVADRLGIALTGTARTGSPARPAAAGTPAVLPTYKHFAQLVNRVRPSTELYKVLLACYWVQIVEETSPFGTKDVNPRLTEISVGLGHVTERLQDLQDMDPSFVIHIKTPGQAKKSYLVTEEGIAVVEEAIRTGGFPKPAHKA
jgi:hypothetical protein